MATLVSTGHHGNQVRGTIRTKTTRVGNVRRDFAGCDCTDWQSTALKRLTCRTGSSPWQPDIDLRSVLKRGALIDTGGGAAPRPQRPGALPARARVVHVWERHRVTPALPLPLKQQCVGELDGEIGHGRRRTIVCVARPDDCGNKGGARHDFIRCELLLDFTHHPAKAKVPPAAAQARRRPAPPPLQGR